MTDTHVLSAETRALMAYETRKRSMAIAYLLWAFLGGFGAHRYYNGRVASSVGMLMLNLLGWLTVAVGVGAVFLIAVGVWALVDAFLIPGWVKRHNTGLMLTLDRGVSPALVAAT